MERLKDLSRAFFRWWTAELRACLPARLKRRLFAARHRLVFDVAADAVAVRDSNGVEERPVGRYARGDRDVDRLGADIRHDLARLDARRRDIVLRLPGAAVLRRRIELPVAAEENLREVVAFDMERQTPFTADQVYFDVRVVRRFADRQRTLVELAVVPRSLADPAVALLTGWGLPPAVIEVPGAGGGAPQEIALEAQGQGAGAGRTVRVAGWALAGLAAVLAVAAVAIPLERQRRLVGALQAQVAVARKEADAAHQTQKDIDRLAALDLFLVQRKQSKPMRLALIEELSSVLPDDTWLFRLRITGDEVQTFGYSAGASNLIGPIEASPLFRSPQFLAPLMRDQRVDAERFHIAFQAEGAPPS